MKVLFLSRWYPYPADNGSKVRVSNLLEGLCEQAEVTLLSFAGVLDHLPPIRPPNPGPREIKVCKCREFNPNSRRALLGYFSRIPRYLSDTYSGEMDAMIRDAEPARYDVVVASQLSMAAYYPSFGGARCVFDEVELGLYRPDRQWALRERLRWGKHSRYVGALVRKYRCCTVASRRELELLAEVAPQYSEAHVVPNCIDVNRCSRAPQGRAAGSLIFVGPFTYWPNYDAMQWFLADIYPRIRAEAPGTQLTITGDAGSRPPLSGPDVMHMGRVADVHERIASSMVSIVPIRHGAGTRLKILESIANRTPVVTTTKGVEGLELTDAEHVLVADTADAFARAVVHLLRNPEYARSLAENAFRLVRSRYDRTVVVPEFIRLVRAAAAA